MILNKPFFSNQSNSLFENCFGFGYDDMINENKTESTGLVYQLEHSCYFVQSNFFSDMAKGCFQEGEYINAYQYSQEALINNPSNYKARKILAYCLEAAGEKEKALAQYRLALQIEKAENIENKSSDDFSNYNNDNSENIVQKYSLSNGLNGVSDDGNIRFSRIGGTKRVVKGDTRIKLHRENNN